MSSLRFLYQVLINSAGGARTTGTSVASAIILRLSSKQLEHYLRFGTYSVIYIRLRVIEQKEFYSKKDVSQASILKSRWRMNIGVG